MCRYILVIFSVSQSWQNGLGFFSKDMVKGDQDFSPGSGESIGAEVAEGRRTISVLYKSGVDSHSSKSRPEWHPGIVLVPTRGRVICKP